MEDQSFNVDIPEGSGAGFIIFQLSGWANEELHIKTIKVTHSEAPAVDIYTPIIKNGDCEGTELGNFFATEMTNGPKAATIVDGAGKDGSRGIVVEAGDNPTNSWDTQFFLTANRVLASGEKVCLEFDYRADKAAGSESQAHAQPGGYIHYDMGVVVNFKPEWQHFKKVFTISDAQAPEGKTSKPSHGT